MSGLRVISGKAGGIRLRAVPGDKTRPITDLVKEALFNIIGKDIEGKLFFDLFGGTGSVGIEALSRGAKYSTFIDINRTAVEIIKANLTQTHMLDQAKVIRADALTILKRPPDQVYDFLYVAPPQYKETWIKTINIIDSNPEWLSENGQIIVQIHPVEYRDIELVHLKEIDIRNYGSTRLIFYCKIFE